MELRGVLIICLLQGFVTACVPVTSPASGCGEAPSRTWRWFWESGDTYRYQGTAHYDQKRLSDVSGEFAELAISPSGQKVAFQGRDAQDDYSLFVGDIGGSIRKVAKTGLGPQHLQWSSDETSLFFLTREVTRAGMRPDAPPDAVPLPDGFTLWRASVADGALQSIARLKNLGSYFVSPLADQVLLNGFGAEKADSPLELLSVASGTKQTVPSEAMSLSTTHAARWSPTGQKFAVLNDKPSGTHPILFEGTDWQPTPLETVQWSSGYAHLGWSSDGSTLDTYFLDRTNRITRHRYANGATSPQITQVSLPALTDGQSYRIEGLWAAPDGNRVLVCRSIVRQTSGCGDQVVVPPHNRLISFETKVESDVAQGMTPLGWLNERQLICHSGQAQDKRLVTVDLPGP